MDASAIAGLFRLDGKVAFVPGGYGGIGEAVAWGLAHHGAKVAIADLTPEQARWIPGPGQHSVGMLVNHLTLWNARDLAIMNGEHPAEISANDETFNSFDATNWPATAARFDAVLTAWERAVESADDAKLHKFASTIAHVTTHNSYHIGQMILTRKLQGSWDSSKGVK